MGQQQILLIVLSVILVGIAVAIGIVFMQQAAEKSDMDNIAWQLNDSGHAAYQHYIKPESMGGGSRDMSQVLADSTYWQPEIIYAQDVKLGGGDGEDSDLIFEATTPNGRKKATLVLHPNGKMDLSWETLN